MPSPTEALWEINNEYRKRLSLLMGHMKLLEQIITMQHGASPGTRASIRGIRAVLEEVDADHHEWRHTYFYRPPDGLPKRRMVTEPQAVQLALQTFGEMLAEHLAHFDFILQAMDTVPRPDPGLTRVIKGNDLWEMCLDEAASLARYDRFVAGQLAGTPI